MERRRRGDGDMYVVGSKRGMEAWTAAGMAVHEVVFMTQPTESKIRRRTKNSSMATSNALAAQRHCLGSRKWSEKSCQ